MFAIDNKPILNPKGGINLYCLFLSVDSYYIYNICHPVAH